MALWFRGFVLLLLLPLALADTEQPCEGFEVNEGYSMVDVEVPTALGVKVLEVLENVESDEACWKPCCDMANCDLAVLSQHKCHLIRCNVNGFNMCRLTAQEGSRSYRKVDAGVEPSVEGNNT